MAPWWEDSRSEDSVVSVGSLVYISIFSTLLIMSFVILCIKVSSLGQKTRNPQQRRAYMGNARRPSLTQAEPTIYVSPANLPPPPKYEAMAPPSYEEVVGIHYPGYRPPVQPITQPITAAMALSADNTGGGSSTNNNTDTSATVITVTAADTRTSVTVATS